MRKFVLYGLALSAVTLGAVSVEAAPITISGSSGDRAASATFDTSGTNLIVTLTNTSTSDALVPVDILTAVFFSLAGDPTLSRVSAVLGAGSAVHFGGTDAGGVVGGEWAYLDGLVGAPGGADEGISSSGFGLFGPFELFPGTNLQGPDSPNGLQYGITSAGDNLATGNAPVTGGEALIKNSVVFTLSGLPVGFNPAALGAVTNVSFQYGTGLTEPNVPGVTTGSVTIPEPATLSLFGVVLAVAAWRRRRRV